MNGRAMGLAITKRRSYAALSSAALACAVLVIAGCVVEDIDALIAERGVTDCPSSSTGKDSDGHASTGTDTDTSAGSDAGSSVAASTDGTGTSSSGEGTTSADSSSGSSSTGPALPFCGDGVVEGDETCDDGNAIPGDGCQECARDSIIFVTSEFYQGFALGGLNGADQRCRSLAAKAGLERPLTFTAWLSTPTTTAEDRLVHSRGRYILVNGLVVAQNWEGLTSGTLENPIMVDENSETQDTLAWTGTLASGGPALGSEFCEDWDDDSGLLKFGGVGLTASVDATWSFFEHTVCDSGLRLYCVQQ